MRTLGIYVEIEGKQVFVGNIRGDGAHDACFSYGMDYLDREGACPISLNLPLQEEAFSPEQTKVFFEGLLPEGFTRQSVAQWLRVDESDYISILSVLGSECLGAIQVVEEGHMPVAADYQKLTHKRMKALAEEGAGEAAEFVTESHLSLAGASGKVGLYYDTPKDKWYLPIGDAPSTHIVKQSHVRLNDIVINEQLVLRTAAKLGIDVVESFIINTGDGSDEDVLFATSRYDRKEFSDRKVAGLACPMRRHQEDLAQALGIAASNKYEKTGDNHFAKVGELIRENSANAAEDLIKLWDITTFNWLVGNTDNHIKNMSLIYSADLKAVRLAPAYDLISTVIYPSSAKVMAFNIGGIYPRREIDKAAWERAAVNIGIGRGFAVDRIVAMSERLPTVLKEAAGELEDAGFAAARELMKGIMREKCKIRNW